MSRWSIAVMSKMSGYDHEWIEAKKNVKASWRSQPKAYLAQDGVVTGIRCVQMDENKAEIADSDFTLSADLVLLAIGQGKQGDLLAGLPGIEIEWGKVVVDEEGATGCLAFSPVEIVSMVERKSLMLWRMETKQHRQYTVT